MSNIIPNDERLHAALKYAEEGWLIIPLKGKKPLTQHGYRDATRDPAQITQWWATWPEANVGLVTGTVSGRLVLDVDIKNGKKGDESLRLLIEEYGELPETLKSVTASGGWHYVFRMPSGAVKSRKGVRDGLDLLADGSYFVAPPSIIAEKAYQWTNECEIAPCPIWLAELGRPRRPSNEDEAASKTRKLIKDLFPQGKQSGEYWMGLCPFHEDKEPSLSITLADGSFRCFSCEASGDFVQLYAKLTGISQEEARDIITPIPPFVSELNKRHAVIGSLAGRAVILNEEYDAFGNYLGVTFSRRSDLELRYCNQRITIGRKKTMSIAEIWFEHLRRREFERIVFEPGMPGKPDEFNLWRGFAVEPEPGDCEHYLGHLYENICQGDQRLYQYLIAWMADVVQRPCSKPGVAVVFRGDQGTGKTIACQIFGSLFGPHFITLAQQRQLLGNFNLVLKDKLVVLAEEAFWAGDKAAEGHLKDLITGTSMTVEPKGKEAFTVSNHIHLLICSNQPWVIPAGPEERRFVVFEVGNKYQQNHSYFEELSKRMNEGGREALLYFLLHYDLSKMNLRQIPQTQALLENKLASFDALEMFLYEGLERGRLYNLQEEWEVAECRQVHNAYIEHAMRVGQNRKSCETQMGRALRKLLPNVERRQITRGNKRVNVWVLPDLMTCREHFDKVMKWPDHQWSPPESMPNVEELTVEEMKRILPHGPYA